MCDIAFDVTSLAREAGARDVVVAAMRSPRGGSAGLLRRIDGGKAVMLLTVALALEYEANCTFLGMTRRSALPATGTTRPPCPSLAPRCGNSAQPRIVAQQKVARVRDFGFKPGTVAGDQKPMADFVAE